MNLTFGSLPFPSLFSTTLLLPAASARVWFCPWLRQTHPSIHQSVCFSVYLRHKNDHLDVKKKKKKSNNLSSNLLSFFVQSMACDCSWWTVVCGRIFHAKIGIAITMTYHRSPLQLCPLPIKMIIYDFFFSPLSALWQSILTVIWGLIFLFIFEFPTETADMLFLNLVPRCICA